MLDWPKRREAAIEARVSNLDGESAGDGGLSVLVDGLARVQAGVALVDTTDLQNNVTEKWQTISKYDIRDAETSNAIWVHSGSSYTFKWIKQRSS